MLSQKLSRTKTSSIAACMLLAAGTLSGWAQGSPDGPGHNRRPHPPTTRPPEITEGMRLGISPPPFEANEPIQAPFESVGQAQSQPVQTAQAPAPRMTPVQKPQPVSQPKPVQVAKAPVKKAPQTEAPAPAPSTPEQPESMPGYIVFVAGILLLFRKTSDR